MSQQPVPEVGQTPVHPFSQFGSDPKELIKQRSDATRKWVHRCLTQNYPLLPWAVKQPLLTAYNFGMLEQALQALRQECHSLRDRIVRTQTEFDDYRRSVEREKAELAESSSRDLLSALLPILDSFELTLRNALSESEDEDLLTGFELIYKQLQDRLARVGLKPMEATGQKFDPGLHQAIATLAMSNLEENVVVEEMRKGYLLDGRVFRPAMVSVSVKRRL